MSGKKKLSSAAAKFRREDRGTHSLCSHLISNMSKAIQRTGSTNVVVDIRNGKEYETAN